MRGRRVMEVGVFITPCSCLPGALMGWLYLFTKGFNPCLDTI